MKAGDQPGYTGLAGRFQGNIGKGKLVSQLFDQTGSSGFIRAISSASSVRKFDLYSACHLAFCRSSTQVATQVEASGFESSCRGILLYFLAKTAPVGWIEETLQVIHNFLQTLSRLRNRGPVFGINQLQPYLEQ